MQPGCLPRATQATQHKFTEQQQIWTLGATQQHEEQTSSTACSGSCVAQLSAQVLGAQVRAPQASQSCPVWVGHELAVQQPSNVSW